MGTAVNLTSHSKKSSLKKSKQSLLGKRKSSFEKKINYVKTNDKKELVKLIQMPVKYVLFLIKYVRKEGGGGGIVNIH